MVEGNDNVGYLEEETKVEEGEEQEDDPLLVHTDVEEEIDLPVQPMPPPPPMRLAVGVRVGRRQPNLSSTSTRVVGAYGVWIFHSNLIPSTSMTTYFF